MADQLIPVDVIIDELRRLDDAAGSEAGYFVDLDHHPHVIMRKIDGKKVECTTNDRLMPMRVFSDRILKPLITAPRGAINLPPEQVRGATHGDYTHMSIVIQKIKDALRSGESWERLSASQKEALELDATKMGRIVCGDPNHIDHWDDIIGYTRLARDRIPQAPRTVPARHNVVMKD